MKILFTSLLAVSLCFASVGQEPTDHSQDLAEGVTLTQEEDEIFMENLDLALEYYQQAMNLIHKVDESVPLSQLIQNQETSAILLRKALHHINICRKYNPNHPFVYELYNGSEKSLKSTPDPQYIEKDN